MLIEPDEDTGFRRVTFTWADTDHEHPAHDVLVRLIALTDYAYDDGELGPYLLEPDGDRRWSTTLRLPSGLRTSYHLCIVRDAPLRGRHPSDERWWEILGIGVVDSTNPASIGPCTFGNPGSASVLELPDALPQPWHARRPAVAAGTLTRHELEGGSAEEPSVVHVYVPPGHVSVSEPVPVAVLFDGRVWIDIDVAPTFDNLIADGAIPPTMAVIIESIKGATRMQSLLYPGLFMPFLLDELMPFVAERWAITDDPARTVLAGQSLGGLAATHAGFTPHDRFGLILSQSGSFWWPGGAEGELSGDALIDEYAAAPRVPCASSRRPGRTSARFSTRTGACATSCESVGMRLATASSRAAMTTPAGAAALRTGSSSSWEPVRRSPRRGDDRRSSKREASTAAAHV